MGEAILARFRIKVRCYNCKKETLHGLDVPDVEDAPTTVGELLESSFLARQSFFCKPCDMPIGLIAGVSRLREMADA